MGQRLTDKFIQSRPVPEKGCSPDRYGDSDLPGFAVFVYSSGRKVFTVQARFVDKETGESLERRIVVGTLEEMRVGVDPEMGQRFRSRTDHARAKAGQLRSEMRAGIDPQARKRRAKAESVTLRDAFHSYINERSRPLAEKSLKDYSWVMEKAFGPWMDKPFHAITGTMVVKRFDQHSSTPGVANLAMRALRAVLRHANGRFRGANDEPLLPENPVDRLSALKRWHSPTPRKNYIRRKQLSEWWAAVTDLPNPVMRDFLRLLLFTGLRKMEAASLRCENIDLVAQTLHVASTKNGESLTLPTSDYVTELLRVRLEDTDTDYVFPSHGRRGHVGDPRKALAAVTRATGIEHTVHDLRRTFSNIADHLEINPYIRKNLMNHRISGDVTEVHYTQRDAERLREPAQRITDEILRCAGQRTGTVVPFPGAIKSATF